MAPARQGERNSPPILSVGNIAPGGEVPLGTKEMNWLRMQFGLAWGTIFFRLYGLICIH
jgi:hypothetical protein